MSIICKCFSPALSPLMAVLLALWSGVAICQGSGGTASERMDLLFWSSIEDSQDIALYQKYLSDFPSGKFAETAQSKIGSLVKNDSLKDCDDCPQLIAILPGEFLMGSADVRKRATPPHPVSINYAFAIGQYEVTRREWNFCVDQGGCDANPRNLDPDDPLFENRPAIHISWEDAVAYASWLSEHTSRSYRLPSEAEWEYSARAGTQTIYWWGDSSQSNAADCRNCGGNWNRIQPAVVDTFPPNPLGLHNTAGGVFEWVQDCWVQGYQGAPVDGSARTAPDCTSHVLRGGSWRNTADFLTSADRTNYDYNVRYVTNGFRIVRDY